MSAEIRVPTLGESIVDATVAAWLKKEGDPVQRGETLLELETDKVNVEVSAEQQGVLQKIIKQVGDVVAVGEVLGLLGSAEKALPAGNGATVQAVPASVAQLVQPAARGQETGFIPRQSTGPLRPPSPLARRIAAEYNIDIAQVPGSSPHGRVTKEDVIKYLEQIVRETPTQELLAIHVPSEQPVQSPAQIPSAAVQPAVRPAPQQPVATPPQGREERIRMSRRRQTIARRLVEAQHTAAMLTTFNEIDMTAIMEVRTRRKDSFKERHGVSLGFMSFFTKAAIGALKAFPRVNAEIQGDEMVLKHYYDIGIAVSTEEGLVVPVVRDADRKGFAEIEHEIADLAKRARLNALTLPELQGGTFTLTNGGVFGSLLSTPILNAPQVAILGMHKIEQRPIALNGQVVIRPMMYVALSYDHRMIDGREAVGFLVKIKELVEDPEILLLEG